MYYCCYIFLLYLFQIVSIEYSIAADDHLIEVLVNGILQNKLEPIYRERDYGIVEANQRDVISFKIKNDAGYMGLWAKLNISNYIFMINTIKIIIDSIISPRNT